MKMENSLPLSNIQITLLEKRFEQFNFGQIQPSEIFKGSKYLQYSRKFLSSPKALSFLYGASSSLNTV